MYKFNFENNNLYIYLYGEIDDYFANKIRSSLDELINKYSYANKVVFNFTNVSFMDSTGIGMLLGRYKKIKSFNLPVYIEKPSLNVEKILEVSGLYSIMPKI